MSSWFQQLDAAADIDELVSVARDYLATWSPAELARLPRECRPGRMRAAADLEDLHASTVDAYRSTRATGDDLTALQRLTGFLVRASLRLVQLRAAAADARESEPIPDPQAFPRAREN